MAGNGDRCERCWGRSSLTSLTMEGTRTVTLCRQCRQVAPQDPIVFREVFLRFGSAKEMISHYDARDEQEALRKLCVDRRLDLKVVIRAIELHGLAAGPSSGVLDFPRPFGGELRDGGLAVRPGGAKAGGGGFG